MRACLYPDSTLMTVREARAGISHTLAESIFSASNFVDKEDIEITPFKVDRVEDLEGTGVSHDDYSAWISTHKELYSVKLEGKLFVYHALRRSAFEKYKESMKNDGADEAHAELRACEQGVLLPFASNFKEVSDEFLFGTINILSTLILKASGFGASSEVIRL